MVEHPCIPVGGVQHLLPRGGLPGSILMAQVSFCLFPPSLSELPRHNRRHPCRSSCGESSSVVVPSEQNATVSDHDELVDSRIPIYESDRESTVTGPVFSGDDSGGIDIEDQYAFDSAEVTALTAVSEQQQLSVPSEFSSSMTPASNTPRNMTPRRGSTGSVFRRRMHTPPPARRSLNGAPTTNQAGLSSDDDKTSPCKIGDASPPTGRSFGDVQRSLLHSDDDEKTSPRKIGGA